MGMAAGSVLLTSGAAAGPGFLLGQERPVHGGDGEQLLLVPSRGSVLAVGVNCSTRNWTRNTLLKEATSVSLVKIFRTKGT